MPSSQDDVDVPKVIHVSVIDGGRLLGEISLTESTAAALSGRISCSNMSSKRMHGGKMLGWLLLMKNASAEG